MDANFNPMSSSKSVQWAGDLNSRGKHYTSASYSFNSSEKPAYDTSSSTGPLYEHTLPSTESSIATVDDDSPWTKRTILTLDGGGVRGISSLLILRDLMREISKQERELDSDATSSAYSSWFNFEPLPNNSVIRSMDYLPCHYFDYIAGTSTGGLIAIMLGRLRMTVDSALEHYKDLSAKVFERPSSRLIRTLSQNSGTSRKTTLEKIITDLRPAHPSPNEQSREFKSDSVRCRTIVCSMRSNESKSYQTPFLFRSYDRNVVARPSQSKLVRTLERNPGENNSFNIAEVAIAASGAPSYFKSIRLHDYRFFDAAIDLNNPTLEAINEVNWLSKAHDSIDLVLSLGTGSSRGRISKARPGSASFHTELNDISERVHEEVRRDSQKEGFLYYRLDVQQGLRDVKIDGWKPKVTGELTLNRLQEATEQYLNNEQVQAQIRECAAALVKARTRRAQTMRWESYATGTRYRCPIEGCNHQYIRFQNQNMLMDHLRSHHGKPPPDAAHYQEILSLLDAGRTNSE